MSTSADIRIRTRSAAAAARALVLASAALAVVCAIAFPLAPVHQPVVTFSWPQPGAGTAVALPLSPYQPVTFRASLSCDAVRATPPGAEVLATTPPDTPDGPVGGLRAREVGGALQLTSNGTRLATVPLPPGPCTVGITSVPDHTEVTLDDRVIATDPRDVRPVVAGLFTAAPSTAGLAVTLRTDTRFQTTPTLLKWLLGAGCLLGLAGVLVGARLADGRPVRLPRRPRAPVRAVDAAVVLGLVVWAAIGPASVDDGYIAGIIRSRGENGYIGNVYRWLNAPEAPFSWFYDVDRLWDALAPGDASVLWMRVPATVLGIGCWLLISRFALPRLGPALARPAVPWIAAVVFGAWWLPFGLTMRPEPWVATGTIAVWVLTERAVATGRAVPLVCAGLLGGLTVALTPGALGGVVPLLVALPALVRRPRPDPVLGPTARVAGVVAALAIAVLPMTGDQSLAALLEGTRVREVIGGGEPWYAEIDRYRALLTTGDLQGGLAARLPVLLLLVALPAVTWAVRVARLRGIAAGPTTRLLATTLLALVLLTLSPTKWTLHFGSFAGVGTAVVVLLVVCWSPRTLRTAARPAGFAGLAVLGAVLLVVALVLAGHNEWAYASDWGVFWDTISPRILRVPLDAVVLLGGLVALVVLGVVLAVRPRTRIASGPVVLVAVVAVVALVGLSFVKVTVDRAGTFSYGSASLAALRGDPCGLAPDLAVETDPVAGLLPAVPGPTPAPVGFVPTTTSPPVVPLSVAGRVLPGWSGRNDVPASLHSGWYTLPADARDHTRPVVVTVSGTTGARASVGLEFAAAPGAAPLAVTPAGDTTGTAPRDLRALAPEGTTVVRVVAVSDTRGAAAAAAASPAGGAGDTPLAVSAPRVPRVVAFDDVVPPGSTALADWPVAFVFPCLRTPAVASGTAELPTWRLVAPGESDAGEIEVAPTTGGPFMTGRLLVDEQRFPVYLDGDPTRDAVGLARWRPRLPLGALTPQVGTETVAGWASVGRATVPVLDTP